MVINTSLPTREFFRDFPEERRNHLNHKLDWRIVFPLAVLVALVTLDRVKMGIAKAAGMPSDLYLEGMQFVWATLAFTAMSIPPQFIAVRMFEKCQRWKILIAGLVVLWSIIELFHGVLNHSFWSLFVLRAALVLVESMFMGATGFILSNWYPGNKIAWRLAMISAFSSVAALIGTYVATGLLKIERHMAYSGWCYVFMFGGGVAFIASIFIRWLMPNAPSMRTDWLSEDDKLFLDLQNMAHNSAPACDIWVTQELRSGRGNDGLTKCPPAHGKPWDVLLDGAIWCHLAIAILSSSISVGMRYVVPAICQSRTTSPKISMAIASPIYITGIVFTLVLGSLSDRTRTRGAILVVCLLVGAVLAAALFGMNPDWNKPTNTHIILVAAIHAAITAVPVINVSWLINNARGRSSVSIGGVMSLSGIGNVITSFTFLDAHAPKFRIGWLVAIVTSLLAAFVAVINLWLYTRRNLSGEFGRFGSRGRRYIM